MRVAVVGGGLSGLVAAHELARSGGVRVNVYEKEDYLGGARTVAVDGGEAGRVDVDLGLMVFNPVVSVTFIRVARSFQWQAIEGPAALGWCTSAVDCMEEDIRQQRGVGREKMKESNVRLCPSSWQPKTSASTRMILMAFFSIGISKTTTPRQRISYHVHS